MIRYYCTTETWHARAGSMTIDDLLSKLWVLNWNIEDHTHTFTSLGTMKFWDKWYGRGKERPLGVPVEFEKPEHEREFLDFHPDAIPLRRRKGGMYNYYDAPISIIDEADLPIYKKGNRWLWKKA